MCTPAQVNEIEPSISTVHIMAKHERSNTFLLFRRFFCVSPSTLTVKWSQIQNLLFGVYKYIWPNRLVPDAIQLPFVALYIIHCWFNRFPPLIFKRTLILRVEEWRRQIFDTSSGRYEVLATASACKCSFIQTWCAPMRLKQNLPCSTYIWRPRRTRSTLQSTIINGPNCSVDAVKDLGYVPGRIIIV